MISKYFKILPLFTVFLIILLNGCSPQNVRPPLPTKIYWNTQNDLKLSIEGTIPHSLHFYGNTNSIKTNFSLSHSNLILQAKDFKNIPDSSAIFEIQNHKKLFFSTLVIDRQSPVISVLSHSAIIRTGGSAIVIYKVDKPHLKTTYIRDRIGKRFYAQPFITQKTFIVFIAWSIWR